MLVPQLASAPARLTNSTDVYTGRSTTLPHRLVHTIPGKRSNPVHDDLQSRGKVREGQALAVNSCVGSDSFREAPFPCL